MCYSVLVIRFVIEEKNTSRVLKVRLGEHKSTARRQDIASPFARHFYRAKSFCYELRRVGMEEKSIRRVEVGTIDNK
jgi:hypothetical protein